MARNKDDGVMRVARLPLAHRAAADVKIPAASFPAVMHLDSVPADWQRGDRLVVQGKDYRIVELDAWRGVVSVESV